MAERRGLKKIEFLYGFDRLGQTKLSQAFQLLVPCQKKYGKKEILCLSGGHENGSDLRPSLIGPTESRSDDR